MRIVFAALVSALVLAAAAPAPTPSPASMARAIEHAEDLIAKGIGDARAELEPTAPKLVRNGELDRIARIRSEAMAKGIDPFAHEDSKGSPAATDMMRDRISPYGAFGENIMYEFHSRAAFNPESFAKNAIEGWLKSPGHRANILSLFRPQRHRRRAQRHHRLRDPGIHGSAPQRAAPRAAAAAREVAVTSSLLFAQAEPPPPPACS
jgi:hypothetical protein